MSMLGVWNLIHHSLVASSCHPAVNNDEVWVVNSPPSTTAERVGKFRVVNQTV